MTDKQTAYIRRLMGERAMTDDARVRLNIVLDGAGEIPTGQASQIIDWLLAQPMVEQPTDAAGLDLTGLTTGHYAVGDVLLKVDAPEAGKWAGWVFVKNGSEYHEEEKFGSQRPGGTYYGRHADLLVAVLDSPTAAAQHYGQITGRCAVCNRTLEDEVSVARGIGPVCWDRVAS